MLHVGESTHVLASHTFSLWHTCRHLRRLLAAVVDVDSTARRGRWDLGLGKREKIRFLSSARYKSFSPPRAGRRNGDTMMRSVMHYAYAKASGGRRFANWKPISSIVGLHEWRCPAYSSTPYRTRHSICSCSIKRTLEEWNFSVQFIYARVALNINVLLRVMKNCEEFFKVQSGENNDCYRRKISCAKQCLVFRV